ncbi:MAG TPA: SLC13 family permease [Thermodesulfobacteriota bacterium]|nr:SLC13 family permease [Thermodesulfobacteriota bacterium]
MTGPQLAALLVFALTYTGLALGGLPRTRLDRSGIALIGAVLMLVTGVVDVEQAAHAVDGPTLLLLFGMMLVIAYLRLAGFFELVSLWVLRQARDPFTLLVGTVVTAGVLSALFVNDVVCLILTPLVLAVIRPLDLKPTPYLLAIATASNIGSVATLTGNPQNMLIGSFSGIPYAAFAARLVPVALAGLLLDLAVLALVYRRELFGPPRPPLVVAARLRPRVRRPLLWHALAVCTGLLAAFLAGVPVAVAAVAAAALLLVTTNVRPRRVYAQVDWGLLVLFAGLFIVLGGLEASGVVARAFAALGPERLAGVLSLSAAAALLSNLVSNVPAVLLFRTVVPALPDPETAWLVLAMASTLAGNLTLIGSVANLIVVEQARAHGAPPVGFGEYLRVGVPLTLLTLAAGAALLAAGRG